jgi:hypothetical protein
VLLALPLLCTLTSLNGTLPHWFDWSYTTIEPCPGVWSQAKKGIQDTTTQCKDSHRKMFISSRVGNCTARNRLESWEWIWLYFTWLSYVLRWDRIGWMRITFMVMSRWIDKIDKCRVK